MDPEAPRLDTATAPANAGRSLSSDLLIMLGQVLRAISDVLDAIEDMRRGSLVARRLISVALLFIRALLGALRPDKQTFRSRPRLTAEFYRALVAPPSRWAAP